MLEITTNDIFEDITVINKILKYCYLIDILIFNSDIIKKYEIKTINNKIIRVFKLEIDS